MMDDKLSHRLHLALGTLSAESDARQAVTAIVRDLAARSADVSVFWGVSEDGYPQVEVQTSTCWVEIVDTSLEPKAADSPATQAEEAK